MKTTALVVFLTLASTPLAADYKTNCALCHGPDGSGKTPTGKALKVKDLGSPEVQALTDAQLSTVIANGKGKMPPFKAKLNEARIAGLVTFIRTLKR